MPLAPSLLFESAFLGKLEQLFLLSKRLFRGDHRAERRSRQTGASLDFADYRNYVLGDDLRSLDWNVYGRLDRLFVKLFEQEQDLHVYFLLDASASMAWQPENAGPDTMSKLAQASHVAASLAYIALANLDRVDLLWFNETLAGALGLARGKSRFHSVLEFLRKPPEPRGETRLAASFKAFAHRKRRRGLVFVLSDLFDSTGFQEGLDLLRYERFEVQILHLLHPAELDPTATGDLRLAEPEAGLTLDLTADEALIRQYRRQVETFLADVVRFCQQRGLTYTRAMATTPFEELVLRTLRDGHVLQ
jgi:uncharacterized protein (DUF58 family)